MNASAVTPLRSLLLLLSVLTLSACGGGGGGDGGDDGSDDNPVPVLNSLAPSTLMAGADATTVTLRGSSFVNASVVRVDITTATSSGLVTHSVERMGVVDLETTFVSSTELSVDLTEADLATAGTASVTVFNPTPGGGESAAQTFTIENPQPVITGLAPNGTQVGGPAFDLLVDGTGFVDGSVVSWGGNPRVTTFISDEQLSAAIFMGDIATIADVDVTVDTPATLGPGGGTSAGEPFSVSALPQPQIAGLVPSAGIPAGNGSFTLTVNGNNFQSISEVNWNGAPRTTTFAGDPTQLTAQIDGADVATAGMNTVTVFTPGVGGGGGGLSNGVTFTVNPQPSVSGVVPNQLPEGSASFVLTVNGANFLNGATVLWNGIARTTRFIGTGQVEADIAAADVTTPAMVNVTVMNPDTGLSNSEGFTINPLPNVATLTPNTIPAGELPLGDTDFDMTVTGANFLNGAEVLWGGSPRVTTFNNAGELVAVITAADIDDRADVNVTVRNPDTGLSNAQTFVVTNPTPVAAGLTPPNTAAGGANFTLSVSGTGFTSESVVRWNGNALTTTRVSLNQLNAAVNNPADIAAAGSAQITVFNPDVGAVPGGTSNERTFYITGAVAPVINTLTPDTLAEDSVEPALQVDGSGFSVASVVRWNGNDLVTTFVNGGRVTAAVTAAQTANTGCFPLTVFTPGGGSSNSATVIVGAGPCDPAPVLDELVPRSELTGSGDMTLNVIGSGFSANSVVRLNGSNRLTVFRSESLLQATVTSADLAAADVFAITAFSPGGPGGLSQPETFFVLDGGDQAFYDNFNREDEADVGPGWTEKTPAAFSVAGRGLTAPNTDPEDYHNVIVYRPMGEDRRDVEASVEFVKRAGVDRFPQLHARAQRGTIGNDDTVESYIFFIDDNPVPGFAVIARQDVDPNVFPCAIDGGALPSTMVEGQRYRMRFSVTGDNPVVLTGLLEELNPSGTWVGFANVTATHADGTTTAPGFTCNSLVVPPNVTPVLGPRITTPGTVGVAKFTNETEFYDNFYWRDAP